MYSQINVKSNIKDYCVSFVTLEDINELTDKDCNLVIIDRNVANYFPRLSCGSAIIVDTSEELKTWEGLQIIFDKLIVAKKAGHLCGPRGIPVPKPGEYFVKPVINIEGMGEKARVEYLEQDTCHLHPGEFWCEIFTGEHISIDYEKYKPILF